jgi:hypothetical protein
VLAVPVPRWSRSAAGSSEHNPTPSAKLLAAAQGIWGAGLVALACIGGVVVGAPDPARAHVGGSTGYAAIQISGSTVRYRLTLAPALLPVAVALDLRLAQGGHQPTRDRTVELVRQKVALRNQGAACAPGPGVFDPSGTGPDTVAIGVDYVCAEPVTRLDIRDDLFDALGPDHHTLAKFEVGGTTRQFVFTPDARETTVEVRPRGGGPHWPGSFFLLGIEHILTGYDHLLFLLALLLGGGGLASLLKIITAFTVAHSITLALAVLNVVVLPDRLVESVIALSIAFVAAENLFLSGAVSHRWVVSFLFGLVHGFGFSGVLRELGLPRQGLLLSLLGFNLGVEAGQALAVAILLPVLILLRRTRLERRVVTVASVAILVVGLVIFGERVLVS